MTDKFGAGGGDEDEDEDNDRGKRRRGNHIRTWLILFSIEPFSAETALCMVRENYVPGNQTIYEAMLCISNNYWLGMFGLASFFSLASSAWELRQMIFHSEILQLQIFDLSSCACHHLCVSPLKSLRPLGRYVRPQSEAARAS